LFFFFFFFQKQLLITFTQESVFVCLMTVRLTSKTIVNEEDKGFGQSRFFFSRRFLVTTMMMSIDV